MELVDELVSDGWLATTPAVPPEFTFIIAITARTIKTTTTTVRVGNEDLPPVRRINVSGSGSYGISPHPHRHAPQARSNCQ